MTTYIFLAALDSTDGQTQELATKLESFPNDVRITTSNELRYAVADFDDRADTTLEAICESDMFILLAFGKPTTSSKMMRNTELGIALGAEIPVTFIGTPKNAYHRFGDVFETVEDFVAAWYERQTS